jgi:tRNA(Ile)-lysidine synthase
VTASVVSTIRAAVSSAVPAHGEIVAAVSGGMDSMVLLDALAATVGPSRLCVATFDHGTGAASTTAVAAVVEQGRTRGVTVVVGRAPESLARTEAAWRDARWRFLHAVADPSAAVVTAHTRDDQIETVLLRLLRGAGTRGLAGLLAEGATLRPLIEVPRRDIAAYAATLTLTWIDDPSNLSRDFARNRARLDLLPALRRVRPEIDRELLEIGRQSADWRGAVDRAVIRFFPAAIVGGESVRGLDVDAAPLLELDRDALPIVWPALLARCGIVADRRGMERLGSFTTEEGRVGSSIQLSGGWSVTRSREHFEIRRSEGTAESSPVLETALPFGDGLSWDGWRFVPTTTEPSQCDPSDPWSAWLPADRPLVVRSWRPGDVAELESKSANASTPRRVKLLLSKAGITGVRRRRWPVVIADERIIWIPGVGRSRDAGEPLQGQGLLYRGERRDV